MSYIPASGRLDFGVVVNVLVIVVAAVGWWSLRRYRDNRDETSGDDGDSKPDDTPRAPDR